MHKEIHQNDIGTRFIVSLIDEKATPQEVDLTGFSIIEIRFKKPNGEVVVKIADIPSGVDPSLGQIEYITEAAASGEAEDLNETGIWHIRARVVLPTGTWTSSEDTFQVNEIF